MLGVMQRVCGRARLVCRTEWQMTNRVWASKIERPLWRASLQAALLLFALFVAYRIGAMAVGGDWRILLLPLAAIAAVTVLIRPHLGLYLIPVSVLLLPTDLDKLPGPSVADSVAEWLLYATTLGMALRIVQDHRLPFLESKVGPALMMYAVFLLVQLARPGEAGDTLKLAFGYLVPAVMYFLTVTLIDSHKRLERLILTLLLVHILFFGIRLYFTLPTLTTPYLVFTRVGGNYEWTRDWALAGKGTIYLANMIAPWALILGLAYPSRAVKWLGVGVSAAAFFHSATSTLRGGAVGVLVGTLAVLVSTRILTPRSRWQTRALLILFLIGAAAVVIQTPIATELEARFRPELQSGGRRLATYRGDWRRFLSSPLIGGGIYAASNHTYFLSVLARWGLLVGMPMAWLWSVLIAERYMLWRKARSPRLRAIAAASFAAMLPAVVDSLLDETFRGSFVYGLIFWILCGMTTVSLRFANAEEA